MNDHESPFFTGSPCVRSRHPEMTASSAPDWRHDVLAACGYWEPLAFLRRRGTTTTDDEALYLRRHSEAMARQLADLGINVAIWHGYKGLGIEFERPDMELTRQFGEHCRRHGVLLATYCNLGTFFAESLFAEKPEAEEWLAMDAFGQPQVYSELYRGYYRYRPCMTHRAFVDYVKRAALTLIRSCGSRWIHFDNNAAVPCYTPRFLAHYRRHLREKFRTDTVEGLSDFRRRFGVEDPDQIVLPRGSFRMPIDTLTAAHEPNMQEWISYRCQLLSDAYAEIVAAIKAEDSGVAAGLNPPMFGGQFSPLAWGVRVDDLARHGDFLYAEDGLHPGVDDGQRLIGYFGNYKLGRAAGPRIMIHQPGTDLAMMEAAVLNRGCLGTLAFADKLPSLRSAPVRALHFIRRHAGWFTRTATMADVAVLRGRDAMVNNWQQTWQSTVLLWQVLQRYGVQWDLLLEQDLSTLAKYRLLILPDCISLSDATLECIRDFVAGGGRVLAIGRSGQCDAWGRSRLGAVTGPEAEMDEEFSQFRAADHCSPGVFARSPADGARVIAFDELASPHPFHWNPCETWLPRIDRTYWCFPVNGSGLAAEIRRGLDDAPLVMFDEPGFVVPQLLSDSEGLALHLLNYEGGPAGPMTIRLNLPVRDARTFSLEDEELRSVSIRSEAGAVLLEVPPFSAWRAFRLRLENGTDQGRPRIPSATSLPQ